MAPPARTAARYQSARDLPSFVELERGLVGMKALSILRPDIHAQVRGLEAQIQWMAETVDGFYRLLGPRNWIFNESFNLERIEQLLVEHAEAPEAAEQVLIDLQAERLEYWVKRLAFRPGLRERHHLLQLAVEEYQAGRYTAMIHIVLSVMDGYVNDVTRQDRKRRGLHAQSGEEMEAWDSVVSHTEGLARIHEEVFTKSFFNLVTDEVTELYRNGIVHGTIVNYGNPLVAAKAWNYLFAVVDWAEARAKAAKKPEPALSMVEMGKRIREQAEYRKALDVWEPRIVRSGDPEFESEAAYIRSAELFDLWSVGNWSHIAAMTSRAFDGKPVATPKHVKEAFEALLPERWAIHEVRLEGAAAAIVEATIWIDGAAHRATLRWTHEGEEGGFRAESQEGDWRLIRWAPAAFLDQSEAA